MRPPSGWTGRGHLLGHVSDSALRGPPPVIPPPPRPLLSQLHNGTPEGVTCLSAVGPCWDIRPIPEGPCPQSEALTAGNLARAASSSR